MLNDNKTAPTNPEKPVKKEVRKPYITPSLEELGDLRTRTLGSSVPDVGDYSAPFNTRPF